MWFRRHRARDTHSDLEQAEQSLRAAEAARIEQQRKREHEQEGVIRRMEQARATNNIALAIRRALQHGGH